MWCHSVFLQTLPPPPPPPNILFTYIKSPNYKYTTENAGMEYTGRLVKALAAAK